MRFGLCGLLSFRKNNNSMTKTIMYLHGKGGNAAEAERYKKICNGYDVFGIDYKGQTPWQTKAELTKVYDTLAAKSDAITLIANSIGAYFAMNALQNKKIEKALLISPIVNMEKLICDMISWANVTETELKNKKEIPTDFGETLSWEYLCYVRANPIQWNVPTKVLYAERDNLTSHETVEAFCKMTNANLTVMKNGEHWFHTAEQLAFLDDWVTKSI